MRGQVGRRPRAGRPPWPANPDTTIRPLQNSFPPPLKTQHEHEHEHERDASSASKKRGGAFPAQEVVGAAAFEWRSKSRRQHGPRLPPPHPATSAIRARRLAVTHHQRTGFNSRKPHLPPPKIPSSCVFQNLVILRSPQRSPLFS